MQDPSTPQDFPPPPDSGPPSTPGAVWNLAGCLADLRLAFAFLTRPPLPVRLAPRPVWWAVRCFPRVGIVIGLGGRLVYSLGLLLALPPLGAALFAIVATGLLTGALHEDGLADSADGLVGGHDRDRRLAIMSDSRI